jgi:hypothetical protein
LWAADHRSEIEAWRDTLAQNERDKMNHPTTLRRKYEATHKVVAVDPNAPKKETSREALIRENEELRAENERLKRDGGSLFDLNQTSVKDIAKIAAENMSLDKLTRLQTEIAKRISERKAKAKAQCVSR